MTRAFGEEAVCLWCDGSIRFIYINYVWTWIYYNNVCVCVCMCVCVCADGGDSDICFQSILLNLSKVLKIEFMYWTVTSNRNTEQFQRFLFWPIWITFRKQVVIWPYVMSSVIICVFFNRNAALKSCCKKTYRSRTTASTVGFDSCCYLSSSRVTVIYECKHLPVPQLGCVCSVTKWCVRNGLEISQE